MNKRNFRSHFMFTRSERNGILVLAGILIVLLLPYQYVLKKFNTEADQTFVVGGHIQKKIDSIKAAKAVKSTTKHYPFNPNFISDFKAYMLGLDTLEYQRFLNYRAKGKWVNSAAEFQKITGISDSLLAVIQPLFKFPQWVNKPKKRKQSNSFSQKALPLSEKTDLNTASVESLQQVYGIGPALSSRIIKFREKLGGFSNEDQLYGVYGLKDSVIHRLLKSFAVKTPLKREKMLLANASASDIATIPGISFDMARRIWEFHRLREGEMQLSDLGKIEGMTPHKLRLISVYLSTANN